MVEGRAGPDEPDREGRYQVEVEAQHHDVDRAVDCAVKRSKRDEDPCRDQVGGIDLARDEQVQRQHVEQDRNLEEVLEIVRWVGDRWRGQLGESAGNRQLFGSEAVVRNEVDAPYVQMHPDEEGEAQHREHRTKDRRL